MLPDKEIAFYSVHTGEPREILEDGRDQSVLDPGAAKPLSKWD